MIQPTNQITHEPRTDGLDVSCQLTMGSSGNITNDDDDYSITDEGFGVTIEPSNSFERKKSYAIQTAGGTNLGAFWGSDFQDGFIVLQAFDRRLNLVSDDGPVSLRGRDGSGFNFVVMSVMPTNEPAEPDRVWKNGNMLSIPNPTMPMQLPSFTTTELNAMSPSNGMIAFNTTTQEIWLYRSGSWTSI